MNQTDLSLQSGSKMPQVGLGCWKIPNDLTKQTVYNAIVNGYRLIDEACDYGNEVEAGQGIKQAIDDKIVSRSDLFITSKLWNTYHRKENVKPALLRTLKDLDLEYLDLYLIHFPISLKFVPFQTRYPPEWVYDPSSDDKCMIEDLVPIHETWKAMEELVQEGLVKHIGVSNMNIMMLRDILSYANIKPTVLQVEIHPYNSQTKLIQFCSQQNIAVTAYSHFGSASYVEIGLAKANESAWDNEHIKQIAQQVSKTPAQVISRWAIQRKTAIIPKTINPDRLKENISLFDFELTQEQVQLIDSLNQNKRYNDPGVYAQQAFNKFYPIFE